MLKMFHVKLVGASCAHWLRLRQKLVSAASPFSIEPAALGFDGGPSFWDVDGQGDLAVRLLVAAPGRDTRGLHHRQAVFDGV